jgi:hypothetical protein
MATGIQVVFDCADPRRMAAFWAAALDYTEQAPPDGFESWQEWLRDAGIPEERWNDANAVVDPVGVGPRLFFQRVPETKAVKNRVHLDLNVGGGRAAPHDDRVRRVDAEIDRLLALGATRHRVFEERGEYWVAVLDPEGNEFDLQ